ncbi:MAG: DoxX family membrane protein [Verrucomicrobiaceae bacterium]|jgi:uncharacterized membrane protein YphA (DoxX/SURF4 family)|nr:DoxX family membrane protein [Verrucomicrobiaceae bacterium]
MIEYYGENPAANQNPWSGLFKTIVVLRMGTGVLLLTRHGIAAVTGAYHFLWNEQEWDWARLFADNGVPYAHLTAPAVALVVAAVGLGWTLGFLTRFFAIVFLPVVITALIMLQRVGSVHVEAAWLYALITFTLLLFGSGAISLDKLFHIGGQLSSPSRRR